MQALVIHPAEAERLARVDELVDALPVQQRLHELAGLTQVEELPLLRGACPSGGCPGSCSTSYSRLDRVGTSTLGSRPLRADLTMESVSPRMESAVLASRAAQSPVRREGAAEVTAAGFLVGFFVMLPLG